MNVLTLNQFKLNKSLKRGWKTVGINLSPATEASEVLGRPMPSMCAMAGACAAACLVKTGMNQFPTHAKRRAQLTSMWVQTPRAFVDVAVSQLATQQRRAMAAGLKFAVRPNLLSDQPRLALALAARLPEVQFYDYTKLPRPVERQRPNYHLTYSVSERTTREDLEHCLQHGVQMAVVVAGDELPPTYRVLGHDLRVLDGDVDDLRFLDPKDSIVMLKWKGSRQRALDAILGGFVVDPMVELCR